MSTESDSPTAPNTGARGGHARTDGTLTRDPIRRHDEQTALAIVKRELGHPLTAHECLILGYGDRNITPGLVAGLIGKLMATAKRASVRLKAAQLYLESRGLSGRKLEITGPGGGPVKVAHLPASILNLTPEDRAFLRQIDPPPTERVAEAHVIATHPEGRTDAGASVTDAAPQPPPTRD